MHSVGIWMLVLIGLLSQTSTFAMGPGQPFGPAIPFSDPRHPRHPEWRASEDARIERERQAMEAAAAAQRNLELLHLSALIHLTHLATDSCLEVLGQEVVLNESLTHLDHVFTHLEPRNTRESIAKQFGHAITRQAREWASQGGLDNEANTFATIGKGLLEISMGYNPRNPLGLAAYRFFVGGDLLDRSLSRYQRAEALAQILIAENAGDTSFLLSGFRNVQPYWRGNVEDFNPILWQGHRISGRAARVPALVAAGASDTAAINLFEGIDRTGVMPSLFRAESFARSVGLDRDADLAALKTRVASLSETMYPVYRRDYRNQMPAAEREWETFNAAVSANHAENARASFTRSTMIYFRYAEPLAK